MKIGSQPLPAIALALESNTELFFFFPNVRPCSFLPGFDKKLSFTLGLRGGLGTEHSTAEQHHRHPAQDPTTHKKSFATASPSFTSGDNVQMALLWQGQSPG